MNYYALFLNGDSYVEKCLILLKHFSNANSKSLPHITLRLFRGQDDRLSYFNSKVFSYLNIIEPGVFNVEERNPPYVVYLRCESEELEEIDYRPDFPFSRLHITLYEGPDLEFAEFLYSELKRLAWHFRLRFNDPKHLTEQALGTAIKTESDYTILAKDVLGDEFYNNSAIGTFTSSASMEQKFNIISAIVKCLDQYAADNIQDLESVDSLYSTEAPFSSALFVDESQSSLFFKSAQLVLDGFSNDTEIKKPVQDAIFVTPPEYAKDMARYALDAFGNKSRKIRFGDSAVGTGALFIALKRLIEAENQENPVSLEITSAIGVEIDKKMALEAYYRCSSRNLKVIYGDALSPNIYLEEKRNMMIVNPPYNRHEEIPKEYREQACLLAKEQTGIAISKDAGLYVYHLLIMDKWLDEDGIGVWLIPTIFLQSRYGEAIRHYLTEKVTLTHLHIYNEERLQFNDTLVSTTVVTFQKKYPSESQKTTITFGDSIENPSFTKAVTLEALKTGIKNWRSLFFNPQAGLKKGENNNLGIEFSSLFDVKRGIATGANSFFVMTREKAYQIGIPQNALRPVLPKARFLKSQIVYAKEDGYPDVEQQLVLIDCDIEETVIENEYPEFYAYLKTAYKAENDETPVVERTLVKHRSPWYKQEQRDVPMYLLTYMGRKKTDLPSLYFILNESKAIALNTYLLLYPKPWLKELLESDPTLSGRLLVSLNKSSEKVIEQQTRVYSGGLQKLEPNELKELPISDLPEEIISSYKSNNPQ